MFFILSKLLVNFIYPSTWIFLGLAGALLLKNPKLKRKCLAGALIVLLIFSNPFLLNLFAGYWDIETVESKQKASCAIILGGFVGEDDKANGFFNSASDRFIQAIKLKSSGQTDYLLFSGGNSDLRPSGFREADWLAKELRYFNIPDSTVLIEKAARNTLENAELSKKMLQLKNIPPPYLLVTSAFHMRRSLQTFKSAGVDVIPYSCHYIAGREKFSFNSVIPRADVLANWNAYIKEVVGIVAYKIKGK